MTDEVEDYVATLRVRYSFRCPECSYMNELGPDAANSEQCGDCGIWVTMEAGDL